MVSGGCYCVPFQNLWNRSVGSKRKRVNENIFKEMEEQKQYSHCENNDSEDNSDKVNANHSKPLPIHKEALQYVSN